MDEADIADEPARHLAFFSFCRMGGASGAAQATPSGHLLASVIAC